MPPRAGEPVAAGISLSPEHCHSVVLRAGELLSSTSVPAANGDVEELIRALSAIDGGAPESVTVDISGILLDALVRGAPSLPRVAVIRVVPRAATDQALARSPAQPIEQLIADRFTVPGGHDLLGNELCPLDRAALAAVCRALAASDVRHVAIVAAGSQARPVHERTVADAVQATIPGARISVASDFGGQGLVAREATVALDCALGPLTEILVGRCERSMARWAQGVPLRLARGDGGYLTPSRIRALPVVGLGAADALQLAGAAHLEHLADCRVLLPRPSGQVAGDVRGGLVAVRSGELAPFGVELVVPIAVLTPDPGAGTTDELRRVTEVPVVVALAEPAELACVGAVISRPTAWLDEFAFIESSEHLGRVRRDAQERATAIVMANGAAPGSAFVAEVSAVAVPYSPPGTVRIRVRVAGAPDTDPRRISVSDRMAP